MLTTAGNMKILTLNTKKACSPATINNKDAGSGTTSATTSTLKPPLNNIVQTNEKRNDSIIKGDGGGTGAGNTSVSSNGSNFIGRNSIITVTNHKTNKREFNNHKHNNCKTKCEHRNNNNTKMPQHIAQQQQHQQHQQQKYHHHHNNNNNNNNTFNNNNNNTFNNNNNNNGNRLKKHYNNNNNNNNNQHNNNNYNCNNNNNGHHHNNNNYNNTYNNLNGNYNNNNNNNNSLINRKKYYQQRHQQQQQQQQAQYLQAMQQHTLPITTSQPPPPLPSPPTTTRTTAATIKTNPFNNNNSNYNNKNITNNTGISTTSSNTNNHLTLECTCPALSLSRSSNSSSSTASNDTHCRQLQQQHQQQQQQLSHISTTTTSTAITTTSAASGSQSTCVSCWKQLPKLSQPPPIPNWTNFKTITAASSATTNLQESVASTVAVTSNQSTSKTTPTTITTLTLTSSKSILTTVSSISTTTTTATISSSSTVLPQSLATKKKSHWKNSNVIITSGGSGSGLVGGAVIGNGCNTKQSPKSSNEKVRHVLEKNLVINTGSGSSSNNASTCSNNKSAFNKNNNETKYSNAATEVNAVAASTTTSSQQTKQISKQHPQGTEKKAMTTSLMGNGSGSVSIKNSTSNNNTSINNTSSKNVVVTSSKQQKDTFDKKNDAAATKPMLKAAPLSNNSNCKSDNTPTDNNSPLVGTDIGENRNISTATGTPTATATTSTTTSTTKTSTSTSPLSPNSYSLDFLHSVGVKMTGVAMRSSQGTPNTYGGNHSSVNSPAHNNYSYGSSMSANQPRQHRYGVYGANNNSTGSGSGHHHHQQQHQHHYHHQPTQLTIASFLQKDLLGEAVFANINNGGGSSSSNSNASNTRNSNNSSNDHQQHRQQQQQQQQAIHNQRYHQNYYVSPYHQQQQHQQHQPMIMPHMNYVGSGGVATGTGNGSYGGGGGDLSRLVSNGGNNCTTGSAIAGSSSGGQRSYASYAAYHNLANEVSSGVTKNNPIQQLPPRQMRSYATALSSANNKKSYASSTASSCSTSSSKSVSSNSSNASNRQMSNKPTTNQESNKNSSSMNLAIETFPTKSLGISSAQQRGGNHRAHHHHYHHNQHGHHHHHHHHHHHSGGGGGGGGHQHNQHAMINAPNMVQHQNYYNLTYVNTDGSAALSGTTTRGCSPAPQTTSTSLSTAAGHSCHSPKAIESNSAGPVAMLMSFNTNPVQYQRFANAQQLTVHHQQQQQFHQYQQQQQQQHQPSFFNKKIMTPLTLTVPSLSPSTTPTGIAISNQQSAGHMSASLHNIICCSQLDEATTAAAAAAATPSAVTNDYDSDTSSTHSCTQSKSKYMSLKPKSSSSSSSSWASLTPTTLSPNHICHQTHTSACGPTSTQFPCPLDYGAGSIGTHQTLSNIHAVQHMAQQQNSTTFKSNNDTTCQQLQQLYRNGAEGSGNVITLLNLPTQSSNTLIEDEFHNQRHLYFGSASSDHLNATTTALTNCVNNGFDYWTPSHHSNPILYHLSSAQVPIIPPPPKATSSASSCCGSSPAPSPSGERGITNDMQQQQQQQQLLHNNVASVSSSLSPTNVCVNEQFTPLVIGGNNFANEIDATASGTVLPRNSISNSLPDSDCGHDIDVSPTGERSNHNKDSSHLLGHQQQQSLLIAQHTYQSSSSSTSSLSSSSASTLTSAARAQESARGGVVGVGCVCVDSNTNNNNNNSNSNQMQPHSALITSSAGLTNGPQQQQQQQPTAYLYTHPQQQPLAAAPLPAHNLLFSNPQTHHMRALNNSPSIAQSVHEFFTHTPPDRFLARAHLVETKEAPPTLFNNSKWDILSQGIWEKFREAQQKEETFKQKMRLWRFLYLFIKNAYPRYGLYLVGSTISGFGADTSDVDMCLVSRSTSSIDPRMEALCNLTVLRDCLVKAGEFENFNLIEAKVPILRFRDRLHQLEVDLNFNNCVGIKNTHLLYCYSQLDWRLRPLVLVTKLWAQYHNINNAKNMTISSYSLVLMVIHYLQYAVNPPVLPCLHEIFPEKFPLLRTANDFGYVDMNESMGPYDTKNTQTLGELFLYFLRYYSCFDYAQYAISVRTGGLLPINVCRTAKSPKNDIHQWKVLCIEEPFDLTNTARSVYDYETFEHVKAVFAASWHILEETLNLAAIFSPINLPSTNAANSIVTTTDMLPTNFENVANRTNNITSTTTATTTTAMESTVCSVAGDERTEAHDVARDNIKHSQQYMKISHGFTTAKSGNYEENNISNDDNTMVDNTINTEDDGNVTSKDKINNTDTNATISKGVQKFPKAKDIKSTLTPRQQQQQQQLTKRYGGGGSVKEFQKPLQLQSSYSAPNVVTPSTNPSSCYKSSTKNRNNTNANPPAAASTATIS